MASDPDNEHTTSRRTFLGRTVLTAGGVAATAALGTTAPAAAAQAPEGGLSKTTIEARQHYFGFDNVDPRTGAVRADRVILSWTGQAGFAASFNGHVVLLDSWIARRAGSGGISMNYVGSTPQELAALKPEMDFIGHAHSDHAGDLPTMIRANPGITVLGTEEHCNDIMAEVTDVPFTCRPVFPAGAAFGSVADLPHLIPGVNVTAMRHPHSGATPGEQEIFPPENTMAEEQYPPAADEPPSWAGPTSGSISILWQFRIGEFALLWHNTSGPENAPTLAALRRFPPTDIEIGSIVSAGGNGVTDATRYIDALAPKIFLPMHTDNFPYPARSDFYRPILQQALAGLPDGRRPMLWYLTSPGDYLRPLSFDPRATAWRQ